MQGLLFTILLEIRRMREVKNDYSSLKSVSENCASDRNRDMMQIEQGGMEERAQKGKKC